MDDMQTPDGPLARFVYALSHSSSGDDGARVHAYLRAWPESLYAEIREEVRRWVDALPRGRVEFTEPPLPAMVCSPELNAVAASYLRGALGADAVMVLHAAYPFNGEDFAYFLHQVSGAMFYLGVANPEAGINGVPHSPDFAADEHAIGIGVGAMAGFLSHRLDALA
ncbi:hypothetical protein [Streptomyces pseudovenezuelae]|uniref:Amidohydrolase n=1 Tax=Streptomyces pseudovenezuelae TaxID=67350 RepID=A0ABZ1XA30_9ACTN|nr:hypothetical protein [Streptomyces pseudovenezuelae]